MKTPETIKTIMLLICIFLIEIDNLQLGRLYLFVVWAVLFGYWTVVLIYENRKNENIHKRKNHRVATGRSKGEIR